MKTMNQCTDVGLRTEARRLLATLEVGDLEHLSRAHETDPDVFERWRRAAAELLDFAHGDTHAINAVTAPEPDPKVWPIAPVDRLLEAAAQEARSRAFEGSRTTEDDAIALARLALGGIMAAERLRQPEIVEMAASMLPSVAQQLRREDDVAVDVTVAQQYLLSLG